MLKVIKIKIADDDEFTVGMKLRRQHSKQVSDHSSLNFLRLIYLENKAYDLHQTSEELLYTWEGNFT